VRKKLLVKPLVKFLFLIAVALITAASASADAIEYQVTVNTSSIAGTSGSLDFQFNPGPLVSQAADLQILGFTSDGTLVAPGFPTGDVSGTLPGTLSFVNDQFFNDYFEDFNFGTTLTFDVAFNGPALTAPDGSAAGSAFAFSMFSDPDGTVPVLTNDTTDGFAVTVAVNADGTTTPTNNSPELQISTVAPEPSSTGLLCAGLLAVAIAMRKRVA
jgi:hypothetical protein